MKNIHSIYILMLAGGLWACGKDTRKPAESQPVSEQVVPVKVTQITRVEMSQPIELSGLICSSSEAALGFKTGGIIEKMLVEEGQAIHKGQLLATLDLTEIDAQVSQAQLAHEKSERDLSRVRKLYADTAATAELLQNAETASKMAGQQLTIANFSRVHSKIFSTVDGTVSRKAVNPGETIGPGAVVYVVSSSLAKDWIVRVGVSDKDWTRLRLGDKASIILDAYPEKVISGTLERLAQSADAMTKLYQAEIRIHPQPIRLAPGMFARIKLASAESRKYMQLPVEAIAEGNGKQGFVYILSGQAQDKQAFNVQRVPVEIIGLVGDKVLLSSFPEHGRVITAGSAFLTEESTVTLR